MDLCNIIKNLDGMLVLNNQVFAYTHFSNIRICHVHDDNIWVTLNFSVINDIKRLVRMLDRLKIEYYYTSVGIDFNDDPLSKKSIVLLTENVINILCIEKKFNNIRFGDISNDLSIYKKFLEVCVKFDKVRYAIETIDAMLYIDIKNKSSSVRRRIHPVLTLENINDLKAIRRPLVIQSLLI